MKDTIHRFEETGSHVITDGEQTKPSFATYPIMGMKQLDPNGVIIPFADNHTRQLPKITAGPFRYQTYANSYLEKAKQFTNMPVKQAVISASALSLLYTNVLNLGIETPEEIRDTILEAAEIIPVEQLGTTDDCGFPPFADDTSTSRDTAFSKIASRIKGTRRAEEALNKKQIAV